MVLEVSNIYSVLVFQYEVFVLFVDSYTSPVEYDMFCLMKCKHIFCLSNCLYFELIYINYCLLY